jgi:hypothetical protein
VESDHAGDADALPDEDESERNANTDPERHLEWLTERSHEPHEKGETQSHERRRKLEFKTIHGREG